MNTHTTLSAPPTAERRRRPAAPDSSGVGAPLASTSTSFAGYEIDWQRKLGSGSFGATYAVRGDDSVAVKVLNHKATKPEMVKIVRECACLERLDHPSVISVLAHGRVGTALYCIVMERCAGGELFDLVSSLPLPPEHTARRIFCELLDAVGHCHSRGIAHRDIKLENVLLTESGAVKLIDFGLAHQYDPAHAGGWDRSTLLTEVVGSQNYAAPEVSAGCGYDGFRADMWSSGVVLYTLLAGTFPYHECIAPVEVDVEGLPAEAVGLVKALLEADPARRPTAGVARRHGWCTGAGGGFGAADESSDGLESLALDSYLATLDTESLGVEDAGALWALAALEEGGTGEEMSKEEVERRPERSCGFGSSDTSRKRRRVDPRPSLLESGFRPAHVLMSARWLEVQVA